MARHLELRCKNVPALDLRSVGVPFGFWACRHLTEVDAACQFCVSAAAGVRYAPQQLTCYFCNWPDGRRGVATIADCDVGASMPRTKLRLSRQSEAIPIIATTRLTVDDVVNELLGPVRQVSHFAVSALIRQ
jgi:hypothetical protein